MYTEKNKDKQNQPALHPKNITAHSLVLKKNNNNESPHHPFVGLILVLYIFL